MKIPTAVSPLLILSLLIARQTLVAQEEITSLPDLTIDAARLAASVDFKTVPFRSGDCALSAPDLCVSGTGKRTLMRFDVAVPNLGDADFYLGSPANNPLFAYSPCHGHYHLDGFANYELLDSATRTNVLSGHKQAFCLEDFAVYSTNAGPAKYTCSDQGISVGWQDVYGKYLDCQWLDVTGVPSGNYILRVTINAEAAATAGTNGVVNPALLESDYSNNAAEVPVQIGKKARR